MKERLTNNLGLKFIAVFFTIVLWLVVMNVEDPIDTRTFKGVSVGIRNDDIITSKGKTYSVVGEQSVEVTVKAHIVTQVSVSIKVILKNVLALRTHNSFSIIVCKLWRMFFSVKTIETYGID